MHDECAKAGAMPVQLCFWILQSSHCPWKARASSLSGKAAACPPFTMPVLLQGGRQCAEFVGLHWPHASFCLQCQLSLHKYTICNAQLRFILNAGDLLLLAPFSIQLAQANTSSATTAHIAALNAPLRMYNLASCKHDYGSLTEITSAGTLRIPFRWREQQALGPSLFLIHVYVSPT